MQSSTTLVHRLWNLALVAVAMLAFGPSLAAADYVVGSGEPVVISDDVFDRTTTVISLTGGPGSTDGKSNNGNGNNADGVDSSNPGQGGGGPNGAVDSSCDGSGTCVDDEAGGGSSKTKKK